MSTRPTFALRIFDSELKEIEDHVLKYTNIETGGDLFGLWTRNADPVVQLIIGPGEKCRRTSVSFHQDTNYLQNIGTYVNTSFMLCHIGSWHSHHQLNLSQPSAGDRSTVCNNFPPGLERYIMIIANIVSGSSRTGAQSVVIHPYMFTNQGHVCDAGVVEVIQSPSPFRKDARLLRNIRVGAETAHVSSNQRAPYSPSKSQTQNHASNRQDGYPHPICPNSKRGKMLTAQTQNEVPKEMDADQWYCSAKGQAILMEIHSGILGLAQNGNAGSSRDKAKHELTFSRKEISRDLVLEFYHNNRKWSIEFPKSFDDEPARISYGSLNVSRPSIVPSKDVIPCIWDTCGCRDCRSAKRNHRNSVENSNQDLRDDGRPKYEGKQEEAVCLEDHKVLTNAVHGSVDEIRGNEGNYKDFSESSSMEQTMSSSEIGVDERSLDSDETGTPNTQERQKDDEKDGTGNSSHQLTAVSYSTDDERSLSNPEGTPENISEHSNQTDNSIVISDSIPTASNSEIQPQWYDLDEGRAKLKTIHEQIRSNLNASNVEFSRMTDSYDLVLSFNHHGYEWTVEFPKLFDDVDAKIEHKPLDSRDTLASTAFFSNNIVEAVLGHCECDICYTIKNRQGEIPENLCARLTDDENPMEIPRAIVDEEEELSPCFGEIESCTDSPRSLDYENITSEKLSSDGSLSSTSPSPSPSKRKIRGSSFSPRQRAPYSRKNVRRQERTSPYEKSTAEREANKIIAKVSRWTNAGNGQVEASSYTAGKRFSWRFTHGDYNWIIVFHQSFPNVQAKLFKKGNEQRSFCENIAAPNVLKILREHCQCKRCVRSPKSKTKRPYPPNVQSRRFSLE